MVTMVTMARTCSMAEDQFVAQLLRQTQLIPVHIMPCKEKHGSSIKYQGYRKVSSRSFQGHFSNSMLT